MSTQMEASTKPPNHYVLTEVGKPFREESSEDKDRRLPPVASVIACCGCTSSLNTTPINVET